MLKQNDKKLNDNIRISGCNFRSLQAAAERFLSKELTVKEIEEVYKNALKRGWIKANCYCLDPAKITGETMRILGRGERCIQIGFFDFEEKKWKNWQKKDITNIDRKLHFSIAHWETTVSPSTGHFTLCDVDLKEVFDPWDVSLGGSLGKKSIDRAYLYKIV